jgi:hypothetical protein
MSASFDAVGKGKNAKISSLPLVFSKLLEIGKFNDQAQ